VLELKLSGREIAVYHSHDKLVLRALILSGQYDAIFTGHTHEVRNEVISSTLVLNPGSTCFAAKSNLLEKSSVAVYDTGSNTAKLFYFSKKELS
jgi:putative phosphoesterase